MGNKFFDYLAAGRPIIVIGDDSEAGRIVEDARIGLVEDNPVALAEGLSRRLQEDRPLVEQGDLEACQEAFGKERLLRRWSEAVEAVAEGSR